MRVVESEAADTTARTQALFEQLRAMRGAGPASTTDHGEAGTDLVDEDRPLTDQPAESTPVPQGPGGSGPAVAPGDDGAIEATSPGVGPADGRSGATGPEDGVAPPSVAPPSVAPPSALPPAASPLGAEQTAVADRSDRVEPAAAAAAAGAAGATPTTPPVAASATAGPSTRPRHPAADLPLPRIMAVANQKGGVGKTTTTVNLGASLAELGYRTLVVDLDPQGNATTGLGINARNLEHSIYDVLMHDLPIDECIEPTSVRNLFVAPATIDLAGAEIELVPAFSRELRLRRALAEVSDAYDFTLIDCPPSLGLLTVNGLAAATEVVVPIQCEYYALEGLSQLLRNVNLVQSNLNPPLVMSAIILTMYDARTKLADQVAAEVRDHFGAQVCRNVVPRTVRLSEAPSFGQPIIVFDPSSRGSLAYRELAKEVSGGAPQRTG
jgi:chromosome partitioning protein